MVNYYCYTSPKVSVPKSIVDFRPISVTPVLSHISERFLAQTWLGHALEMIALTCEISSHLNQLAVQTVRWLTVLIMLLECWNIIIM
jgi:hypothetical protein